VETAIPTTWAMKLSPSDEEAERASASNTTLSVMPAVTGWR
jgi:hypothetical protein